jgi:alpha-mannosidase
VFTVVKKAEDGGGLVIRGYESHGRPAEVTLQLPLEDTAIDLTFKPYEIKTLRFDPASRAFKVCDLLENA